MPHDVIATCPVCEHELSVTRLRCRECGTTLEGDFSVGRFGRLTRDQLALLESFLRSRGNLREMERELGISYPTVRGRVEALVRALGLGGGPAPEPVDLQGPPDAGRQGSADGYLAGERRRTLERLARGEISAEQASIILRALGGASTATATAGQPWTGYPPEPPAAPAVPEVPAAPGAPINGDLQP